MSQIQLLIDSFFPNKLQPAEQQKYLNYFLRMLSCRLNSNTTEQGLMKLIKKRVSKLYPDFSVNDKLLRLKVYLKRLFACKSITSKQSVLYCLYSLSENSLGSYLAPTIAPDLKAPQIQAEKMVVESAISEEIESFTKNARIKLLSGKGINLFGNVTEDEILRDLLYIFQAIDGKYITYSLLDDTYMISPNISLAEPIRELILQLCESGWLYKRITECINKHTSNASAGQVVQSFCVAVQNELSDYFRLLTTMERQLQDNPKQPEDKRLDLIKLYMWMQDPMERIKWLAIVCDISQSKYFAYNRFEGWSIG